MPDRSSDIMLNVRVPQPWSQALDDKAEALEAASGARYSRSDVVRMALARFLGLVDPPAEGESNGPTAGA